MTCTTCNNSKETKGDRLPTGWKRLKDQVYCDKCWGDRYMLRAVSVPVASPVDGTWEDLRKALKEMWALTTQMSNYVMTQLYIGDVRRLPGQEKLPPMPPMYLYPISRQMFPGLPSQTVASIENTAKKKYRAHRYDLIWRNKISLPNYRYPTPFPLPNQAWSIEFQDDQKPVVNVRIGDKRWKVRLRGGPQMYRQTVRLRELANGLAIKGELAIYQPKDKLMVKLAGWFPRQAGIVGGQGILRVHTAKESLLVAVNAKDEKLWIYNGDHIRRWVAEHHRNLQRWSEDSKFENRPIPSFADRRKAAVQKYRNRMKSAVQEIAAQLAGYAVRRNFKAVEFDDTGNMGGTEGDRPFCKDFTWFALRQRLNDKLDEAGIEFHAAASE